MTVPRIVTVSHPVVQPHHVCPVPCNVNSDPHPVIHTCPIPRSVPLTSHTVSSVTIPHPVKTSKLRINKLKWEKCSYVHHPPVSVSSLNVTHVSSKRTHYKIRPPKSPPLVSRCAEHKKIGTW